MLYRGDGTAVQCEGMHLGKMAKAAPDLHAGEG
jgi:hypothetical protein